jgi:hypothetical protein
MKEQIKDLINSCNEMATIFKQTYFNPTSRLTRLHNILFTIYNIALPTTSIS